jgi:putative membrane protein
MGRGLIRMIVRRQQLLKAARMHRDAQRAARRDDDNDPMANLSRLDPMAHGYRPMNLFTPDDETRIRDAITQAEQSTSGEIVAVVAARSDSYLHVPFLWAALAALLVPWPLIYLTWLPMQWVYLLQLAVFVALVVTLWRSDVRMALVPASLKRANARRRAVEQFLAQNLHTTSGRTGVLIFVSLAERHVEVLADRGIDEKVPAGTWQRIVDDLTAALSRGKAADGFVAAITACGLHLAGHFPPGSGNTNELPNHLIVLE